MNYSLLIKELLLKDISQIDRNNFPKSTDEWIDLIKLLQRNRLYLSKSPLALIKSLPQVNSEIVLKTIKTLNNQAKTNIKNYRYIKNELKKIISKTRIPLILIKDLEDSVIDNNYQGSLKPFKFDIDVFGRGSDLPEFKKHIKKIGFQVKVQPYGWPKETISQYKFPRFVKDKLTYPKIEYREQALTILFFEKKDIMTRNRVNQFTIVLWNHTQLEKDEFAKISKEYLLFYLCLIYYFEDLCKGLNNLYRIFLLHQAYKQSIDRKKFYVIAKKYKATSVINFIFTLARKTFTENENPKKNNIYHTIAARLIDLKYICQVYLPKEKNQFNYSKDRYIHFLTKGLIEEGNLWKKILFFLHPKRLLFFIWKLIL